MATGAVLQSCINQDYSIKEIDTTMTVLPGLSVPLNHTIEVSIDDIIGAFNMDCILVDNAGNYVLKTETQSETAHIDGRVADYDFTVGISKTFTFPASAISQELKAGSYSLHCPIEVIVDNPTILTFRMSALVHTEDGSGSVEVSDLTVNPGNNVIELKRDDVMALFNPFDSSVIVSDILLTHISQGASEPLAMDTSDYTFTFSVNLPLKLMPGDGIEYSCNTDILKDSGLIDVLEDLDFEVDNVRLKSSADSRVPFELELSAEDAGLGTIFSLDRKISAGDLDAAAATDFDVFATMPDNYNSLEEIRMHIKAVVPQKYGDGILLNKNQNMVLTLNSLEFEDGLTL